MPFKRASAYSHVSESDTEAFAEAERAFKSRRLHFEDRKRVNKEEEDMPLRKEEALLKKQAKLQQELNALSRSSQSHSGKTQRLHSELALTDTLREDRQKAQSQTEPAELQKEEVSAEKPSCEDKTLSILEDKLYTVSTFANQLLNQINPLAEERQTDQTKYALYQRHLEPMEKELNDLCKMEKEMIWQTTSAYEDVHKFQTKMNWPLARLQEKNFILHQNLVKLVADESNQTELLISKFREENEQKTSQDETQGIKLTKVSDLKELELLIAVPQPLDTMKDELVKIKNVTVEDDPDLLVSRFLQGKYKESAYLKYIALKDDLAVKGQISQPQSEADQFRKESLQQQKQEDEPSSLSQNMIQGKISDQGETDERGTLSETPSGYSVEGTSAGIIDNNIMSTLDLLESEAIQLLLLEKYLENEDCPKMMKLSANPLLLRSTKGQKK
ncbi:coiled-coil domain-containing protein 114-like [Xyrichtys novacula]|uniref:Coiled-coil domain-containing protein 114-like n=1 Tax=Xyrichtys novacula TaxID=13765 RepID=A0AAV1GJQ6_XYRNO|nr:coiled-coil domain-containing protein 114-like [Xyrichtys novacula]CAJ1073259.1 coiled-coil domain-containing protein 114-like [Xyrichtys novacula]